MDISTRLFIYILLANTVYILFFIVYKFWRYNKKYIFQIAIYIISVILLLYKNIDSKVSLTYAIIGFVILIMIPFILQKKIEKYLAEFELEPILPLAYIKALFAWSTINNHIYKCAKITYNAKDWNSTSAIINQLKNLLCNDKYIDNITNNFIAILLYKNRRYDELIAQIYDKNKNKDEYSLDLIFLLVRSFLETSQYEKAIDFYFTLEDKFSKNWYQLKNRISDLILIRLVLFSYLGLLDLYENTFRKYENIFSQQIPSFVLEYWYGFCLINAGFFDRGIKIIKETIHNTNENQNSNNLNYYSNIDAINTKLNYFEENADFIVNKLYPILENIRKNYGKKIYEIINITDNAIINAESKKNIITNLLILANSIIFIITHIFINPEYDIIKFLLLGANNSYLVKIGELYRLVSYQFLHYGVVHVVVNILALSLFGSIIESLLGSLTFITLYILSGIVGGVISNIFAEKNNIFISIGASASISGLVGSTLFFSIISKNKIRKYLGEEVVLGITYIAIANVLIGIFEKNIDNYAHIGGFLSGIILSIILNHKFCQTIFTKSILSIFVYLLFFITLKNTISGYTHPKYFSKQFISKNFIFQFTPTRCYLLPKFWKISHIESRNNKVIITGPFGESLEVYELKLSINANVNLIIKHYIRNKINSNSRKGSSFIKFLSYKYLKSKIDKTVSIYELIWLHNINGFQLSEKDYLVKKYDKIYWLKFWLPTGLSKIYKDLIYNFIIKNYF